MLIALVRPSATPILAAIGVALIAVSFPGLATAHGRVEAHILQQIEPGVALAPADSAALIEAGRRLFFEETFGGNGRTCGTCHPATNNFTLDPAFIRRLPASDPLFVHETQPALALLENRRLLRNAALILENLDGFDKPGVMRSVPHTLGLSQSITADRGTATRPPFPLANATGWSGDGAPGTGSLREFAIGAVVQHAPKTLNRVPGIDFRLPTEAELDALLAFQLSLGRQADVIIDPANPAALVFSEPLAEDGKRLFHAARARDGGTRSCGGCHNNAGANDSAGNNRTFATGTMFLANVPACRFPVGAVPGDGGFGTEPVTTRTAQELCDSASPIEIAFRGNLSMNTPSLIEAADTPPFFHNNTAATLEDAIAFYASDVFNASPAGNNRAFILDDNETIAIGALLRVLNALDNLRSSNDLDQQAMEQPRDLARDTIVRAVADTQDAISVLTQGPRLLYADTGVQRLLKAALRAQRLALEADDPIPALQRAIALKSEALGRMLVF